MAEAGSTRTHAEKSRSSTPVHARQESPLARSNGLADDVLALQRSAGNRAVGQLVQSGVANAAEPNNSSDGPSKEIPQRDSYADVLTRAAQEPSQGLDKSVRVPMEQALGADLGGVRVHSGVSSRAAAESLGARAYTVGSDIYLGRDAQNLNALKRNRLLAHEAVHTIQQGGRPVALQGKMEVSQPGDSAEVEADNISKSIISEDAVYSPSLALGLRDQLRATPITRPTVSRVAAPLIQRDIKDDYPIKEGNFRLDLETKSKVDITTFKPPGTWSGLFGTIKFKANNKAPDSKEIKLLQVVKVEDLGTGKDLVWTGGEADRNKMRTTADKSRGIEGGFFVDHSAADPKATPRAKKTDAEVSPYFRDYWPNAVMSQDGSKKGKAIQEASLADFPSSTANRRFTFETAAKATDTGHIYGTVMWGFTISDAAKGVVDSEHAYGRNVTTLTTDKAIEKFNEFYRNPGSSTAP